MSSPLLTVYATDLTTPVKALFGLIYAHAGADGKAAIAQDDICAILHLGAHTLRTYRRELAAAGICESYVRGGVVVFTISPDLTEWTQDVRSGQSVRETDTVCPVENAVTNAATADAACAERTQCVRSGQSVRETDTVCPVEKSPHTPLMIDREIDKLINNQAIYPDAPAREEPPAPTRGVPPPALPADPDLTADQIAASLALLEQAGVKMPHRAMIAAGLQPEIVYRHYADWWTRFNAGKVSVGALVHQCCNPRWIPPPLTDTVRNSREYRAFMRAAYPEQATAAEDTTLPAAPGPRPGDWEPWPQILQSLSRQMPRGTFDLHLRASRADADGDQVVVTAPSKASAEWLDRRLRPIVERAVQRAVNRDLTLAFIGADQ